MKEPVEYTKWACAYKCRRSYRSKKKAMEHHKVCVLNPSNRSCKTCAYSDTDTVDDPHMGGGNIFYITKTYRSCQHPTASDAMIDILDALAESGDSGWLPVHTNCDNWKALDRKMAIGVILENMEIESTVSDQLS
jgi:hypothetical protein